MRLPLTQPTPAAAYTLLTIAMLFWAGNFTIGRWAADHIPPVTFAALRWTGAALIILPFAWRALRRDWPLIRDNLGILLVLGVTGTGLFNTLQYIALTDTTATNAGIINSTAPVMIVALGLALNREAVAARQAIGIALSLGGVLLLVVKADWAELVGLSFNTGDIVMLLAVAIITIYTVLLSRQPKISVVSFAAVIYGIAAVLNVALAAIELSFSPTVNWVWSTSGPVAEQVAWPFDWPLDLQVAGAIAYVAVFPSVLAYLCFNRGVSILGPTRASPMIHLLPVFTTTLAFLFLGETPAPYHAAGFALVLVGVWLAVHANAKVAPPAPEQ